MKKNVKIEIETTDNISQGRSTNFPASSGVRYLRLFRKGSLIKLWGKNVFELTEEDSCYQIAATKVSPRKTVCEANVQIMAGENNFTAYAFNHENVKSTDATVVVNGDFVKQKGKLQILSVLIVFR